MRCGLCHGGFAAAGFVPRRSRLTRPVRESHVAVRVVHQHVFANYPQPRAAHADGSAPLAHDIRQHRSPPAMKHPAFLTSSVDGVQASSVDADPRRLLNTSFVDLESFFATDASSAGSHDRPFHLADRKASFVFYSKTGNHQPLVVSSPLQVGAGVCA